MNRIERVSRRGFLGTAFGAGALVLGVQINEAEGATPAWMPSVYLGIEPNGTAVIVAHRSEMGTGIRTVLPMVVADELEADWKKVRIEQAIGDVKYGSQNTDGSCSIRDFYDAMRAAGATVRLMLEQSAAKKWNVPVSECKGQNHFVVHAKSGKKAGYGELVKVASTLPVPKKGEWTLKPESEFRYIGKEMPTMEQGDHTRGAGKFGIDAKMPGMLYASIERPPVLGAKLKSFDDAAAKQVKGVVRTATIDAFKPPHNFQALGGVAVLADSTWAAAQGRKKLKVEWDLGPNGSFDSAKDKAEIMAKAMQPGKVVRNIGDVDKAFGAATNLHEASYYIPLLSHAPMEPPAAVAEWKDGKVVTYAATQNPQAVQEAVASAMGIKKEDVTCHVTLLGGGFGRKSKPDYVCEAAMLSKTVGKPVKVVFSREDDIKFDFYHANAGMYMKAALDEKGRPTAWLHRSVFPSIGSTFDATAEYGQEFEMGMGWVDLPYAIANHRAENGPHKNHVRIGWMRAVAHIYHAFAIHSFVDELAAKAGRDRVEYILDLLGPDRKVPIEPVGMKYWNNDQGQDTYPVDTARLKRVVELVAEKSGWANKKPQKGRALGIAAHRSFLSYVAAVVEVVVDDRGRVTIPRVDIAIDAGRIINPERAKSQLEGAAVFGTSLAMMGEITAADGKIVQSNFNNYPVARMSEAPLVTHVHLVPSNALPAGIGEPGVPPIAPAITSAIFAATGKRVRELPIRKTKLV
ncbi:MAG: molybdopterin-dependent oxidoreductase [Acidobacteria bacterium]|nr:molybdopterin-dependent oxidoreductase [Acidobacteriota bacterium]